MYERLKQLLEDLSKEGKQPFIGYGNPDAKILIVGKECALDKDQDKEDFIEPNFEQWKESFGEHGFGYQHRENKETPYSFEDKNFHPIFPFYRQHNTLKQKGVVCPGNTYYYYQQLVDKIRRGDPNNYVRPEDFDPNRHYIDFFKDCFITELNDICRPNNNDLTGDEKKETEKHIRKRFEWMRRTNFFNHFKIVILACGPYANAIKKDECLRRELFGDAFIVYCGQLSQWRKSLDDKIPEMHKLWSEAIDKDETN